MATGTHTLLERITVGAAGAASVTFSSIPQTGYTDLKIVCSTRQTGAATTASMNFTFNGSSTGFTYRALQGSGSSAASFSGSTGYFGQGDAASATASTFGNAEFLIPNYTSSNYKSVSADTVDENNATTAYAQMTAVLWSNTAAINSISLVSGNGNWAQYSTFSLYGIAASGTTPTKAPKAVGGDIIQTDGTYWYHAFINTGAFVPATGLTADVLVVAGGGGGLGTTTTANKAGGGGGAGGLVYATSQTLTSGTSYTATIGGGGTGARYSGTATNGVDSSFNSNTATGGGYGGYYQTTTVGSGGSGGGAGGNGGSGGTGVSGQGYAGGANSGLGANLGAGGGGAGAVGNSPNTGTQTGGAGGDGKNTYSSWLSATGLGVSGYLAGGGGGGSNTTGGAGGAGGGGAGTLNANGTAGTANTGGGGGGAGNNSAVAWYGGDGGSGVVIVRYLA